MRIGIISDTHIKNPRDSLPREIFEIFKGVDKIFHAGDLVDLTVLEKLSSIASVTAVYGNMDPVEVRQQLPEMSICEIEGKKIGMIHGKGPPWGLRERVINAFLPEKPDVIIYGHSHAPETVTSRDKIFFINPGSPTDKIFTRVNSVILMEITKDTLDARIIYI